MNRLDFEEVARRAKADADAGLVPAGESDNAEVIRLADLTAFEYDRERIAAANRLCVRPATLDRRVKRLRGNDKIDGDSGLPEIEPWPELVDGAALLDEISAMVRRHVSVPTRGDQAIALWILHAHTLDAARIAPRLGISSPVPECGKTTLLRLIGALVPRRLFASNITSAATFRAIEKWSPTLIVDEADTFLKGNEELRGVLNSGHAREAAFVVRTVGENHEPRKFSTWAAVAVAFIGKLPATLESRSIHIEMRRLLNEEKVEPFRPDRSDAYIIVARKAAKWAADNLDILKEAEPELPEAFGNRRADNWRPLLAIAELVGGDWPVLAREAALTLDHADAGQTTAIMLLSDVRGLFNARDTDRLFSDDIASGLAAIEGRPWVEWGRSQEPITKNAIARLLKPFGIYPGSVRIGEQTGKGYHADDFADAFARYLPAL
jgi:putative DNA primase/helicase